MPLSNCQPLLRSTHAVYAEKRRNQEYIPGGPEQQQTRHLKELDATAGMVSKGEMEAQIVAMRNNTKNNRGSTVRGSDSEGNSGPRRPYVASRGKKKIMWVRHDFIYKVEFFQDCDPRFVDRILPGLDARLYLPGSTIIREGDEGNSMSIIHRGRTSITVGGHKVAELSDGACFGEIAVLGISSLRIATVTAIQMCDVRTLSRLHFLRVLSEFPSERTRFKEIARQRAMATEGAAEQMQHSLQQRRLELRHAISMEKCILMGGLRLAKAQSMAGELPPALADAYDVRPGYQDLEGEGSEEEVCQYRSGCENQGKDANSSSNPEKLVKAAAGSAPSSPRRAKAGKQEVVVNVCERQHFQIQEAACAIQQELKNKGKLMLKYARDFSKDLRNKSIKDKGTKGVAEALFDHISNPDKELDLCSNISGSPRKNNMPSKSFGQTWPRRRAMQGNRGLVEQIRSSVADNDELHHAVGMNQWAEEHRRKLEHSQRIKAAAEARLPKNVSYVLSLDGGHSLPNKPSVHEEEEAPPSLDSTLNNTSLSMDPTAYCSVRKAMHSSIYSGSPDTARMLDGGELAKESSETSSKQPSRVRKDKTTPLQMQRLQAQSKIFTPLSTKRPKSTPPGMGTPMSLSYELWIREGAESALAQASHEGNWNQTLSSTNSPEAIYKSSTNSPEAIYKSEAVEAAHD